ncbi:MAG: hypothetical protein J0L93_01165 [Deltaproteobacteria bacterium]|nr:hypothetical protein [Deltaproteobacteria bacterium]
MLFVGICSALISMSSLTVEPVAFTYHGMASKEDLKNIRKRGTTLDGEGRATFHKGIGLTYRSQYFQLTGIYFKNSVNQNSGGLMFGPKMDFWKRHFTLGLVGGAYMRESMAEMRFPLSYKNQTFEVAPMLMATGSASVRIYRSLWLEVIAGSNYVLNFFTPGIRVDI